MPQDSSAISSSYSIALATADELEPHSPDAGSTDHRVSRLAARRALGRAFPGADNLRIEPRPGSAPAVIGSAAPIAISLTGCNGHGAAIAARGPMRVGIDLEREDAVAAGHTRYFLTTRERAALGARSAADLWALKEAAWKALSLPDDTCFHDLELQLTEAGIVEAVRCGEETVAAAAALARPWPGYVLATIQLGALAPTDAFAAEAAR